MNDLEKRAHDPNLEDIGFLSEGGQEHLFFHHNEITRTMDEAFGLEQHIGPTTISDNSFELGYIAGVAVFITNSDGDITTPQRFCRNSMGPGLSRRMASAVSSMTG